MNKKVISYALAATMIGSLFTFNVQAKEQITDSISLPVQLYDYDADGAINDAIVELNYRFKQHNLGYEFGLKKDT